MSTAELTGQKMPVPWSRDRSGLTPRDEHERGRRGPEVREGEEVDAPGGGVSRPRRSADAVVRLALRVGALAVPNQPRVHCRGVRHENALLARKWRKTLTTSLPAKPAKCTVLAVHKLASLACDIRQLVR